MKRIFIKGAIFASILLGLGITANAQRVLGGYQSKAVDDKEVTAAADFAVSKRTETNSEQEGLELVSIDKAESQVVAGINYRLCLTVSLDDEQQQVQVVVFKSLKGEYSLKSWEPKDCSK